MRKHTSTMFLLVVATAAVSAVARLPATGRLGGEAEVVIRGIDLIDVRQGLVRRDIDIVVRATRIASIAPSGGLLPVAKTVIEGRGKYALPGLIDPRVRLAGFTRASVAALLAEGITAVRDMGTEPARIAEWRRALAHGQMYAPRIARACGGLLDAAEPGCNDGALPDTPALGAIFRERAAPGLGLHDVLEQLVRAGGVTSVDALRAATFEAALALALPHLGELVMGHGADIVVTTANPLVEIRNARAIDAVVFRGEALTRAHLNQLAQGRLPSGATVAP
jgi:imidazolonepropionase-like amidohydrolase